MKRSTELTRRQFLARSAALMAFFGGTQGLLQACAAPPAPTNVPTQPSAPSSTSAPASGQPQMGGVLRVGTAGDPQKPDPHYDVATVDFFWADQIFNGLVQYDVKMDPVPALAEKWEVVNPTKITFTLRRGVKFHDGRDFTAEDVRYSFERILNPETQSRWAPFLKPIASIDTPDPFTVTLNLSKPDAPMMFALANCRIVPKGWKATDMSKNLVGTGPFVFAEYTPNQLLRLTKNPNYFIKGLPYLDEIRLIPTRDSDAKLLGLQTGQFDLIDRVDAKNFGDIESKSGLQLLKAAAPGVTPSTILMNNAEGPTSDKRVRQAIAYAFPKETYLKTMTFGVGEVAHNLWPKAHWTYNPSLPKYDVDLKKAKDLLDAAGVQELKAWTSPFNEVFVNHALLLKDSLAQIGVNLSVQQIEWTKYLNDLYPTGKMGWNVAFTNYGRDYEPNTLLVPSYVTGNEKNYSNKEVDKLAEDARGIYDRVERKKLYDKLQAIVLEEVPGILTIFSVFAAAASKKVQGFQPNPKGDLHLHEAWLQA